MRRARACEQVIVAEPLLDPRFALRVLCRLGIEPPGHSFEGLRSLYSAWCQRVPFDNVRKLIHLRAGNTGRLPGDESSDFFSSWLRWGCGGTCWAGNGALRDLLVSLGFDARCATATMMVRPGIPPNHGTVIVHCGAARYLVDASILFDEPLLLDSGVTAVTHGGWGVQCRPEHGTWTVRWRPLHSVDGLECHINDLDVPREAFYELHERSRAWSGFNYELTARINRGDQVVGASFGQFARLDASGDVERRPITQDERRTVLREHLRMAEELIQRLPEDMVTPPPPGSSCQR
jgi:arylamine N-acetyltransferase